MWQGSKYQNGIAERTIQVVAKRAPALLLHSVLHWADSAILELNPISLEATVALNHKIPQNDMKLFMNKKKAVL